MKTEIKYSIEGPCFVKRTYEIDETRIPVSVEGHFYVFNKHMVSEERVYLNQVSFA